MARKLNEKKTCFVVGPIGDDDSDDRIHADWLLEEIIEPVFREHFSGYQVSRADRMPNPGQITTQVITALLESELVIADLSKLNPNAFYEIGIRHMVQKPIIHMHEDGQRIPFDVAAVRSIKFSRRRPSDLRAARAQLLSMVSEALNPDHEIDNPVTFSRGTVQFEQTATDNEKLIQEQIADLSARLGVVEEHANHPGHRDINPANSLDWLKSSFKKSASVDGGAVVSLHVKGTPSTDPRAIARDAELGLNRFFNAFSTVELGANGAVFSVPFSDNNLLSMEYVREEMASKGYNVRVAIPKLRAP